MAALQTCGEGQIWQCLHCRSSLIWGELAARCRRCDRQYPVVAGIPLLVREPADYLWAERASLVQTAREARERGDTLDQIEPYAQLPDATLDRHRDVLVVEATQAEMLLSLLEPTEPALRMPRDNPREQQAVPPGWSLDALVPYLLRDWTQAPELRAAGARINAALEHAFPDPRSKMVAFAGCGAGGLLAEISPQFERILGFDLTLPILAAARRLLDGETLDLALPRVLNERGRITLGRHDLRSARTPVDLVAMDTLDTAFADGSIDCIVTVFLTDILPDPRDLAAEVHRVLPENGVWINYGPSGNNLKALWRFDQTEAEVFFKTAGFTVVQAEAQRGTNLDISDACPSISFRNAILYMTLARKTRRAKALPAVRTPRPDELWETIPQHFPGARLVHRLEAAEENCILLQHDRVPGRAESWRLGSRAARIMALVDGKRTVGEITDLLHRKQPPQSFDETLRAFDRFLKQGLLNWRGPRGCSEDRS
jgi:SAM-dependent methyltransferase